MPFGPRTGDLPFFDTRSVPFVRPLGKGGAGNMKCRIGKCAALGLATIIALGFAAPVSAQVFTGRIDMTIEDATGGRLPGVSVDLTGPSNQNQVSDAQGEVHFLNLPVGLYSIKATLQGFNDFVNNTVQVATGAATPITAKL